MSRAVAVGSGPDESFPKRRRLRKRREFLSVQGGGRKIHLRDLLAMLRTSEGLTRLGITVSRKVGNAVQRNRVKRIVRESWRVLLGRGIAEGYDVVIIAKRSAAHAPRSAVLRQLEELGQRLNGPRGR